MNNGKLTYLELASSDNRTLERYLLEGIQPDPEKLVGWEFRGFNSLDLTTVLGFRKFKKGFYRDGQLLQGYNVKVKQNGLVDPWIDVVKGGKSVKHGFYDVYPVRADEKDNLYANALLLNYASKKNPFYDPSRVLRDYLVQPDPQNQDLYLGKAFLALGSRRIFVSYFILGRENPSTL